jgi:3-dehydroquinate synthase
MANLTVAGVTSIVIGEGLPETLLPNREGRRRVAVLTQPGATSHALEIANRLEADGLTSEVIGLPDRDEAKTLEVTVSVYEGLARLGLTRDDTIVGVGGGSVTDVAGYIGGTWLRGVEVVHFPTTLLGAVDASIGGKTGVNLAGKNLVGVIWHPTLVVIDTLLLGQLPIALAREGMSEILKAGLVGDSKLCELLNDEGLDAPLGEIVERAIAVKARIVTKDEREQGERAFLNFGHTVGHAIEYASSYSHGESVSLGMISASHVSEKIYGFSNVDLVKATLTRLGLPTTVDGLDLARVHDLLRLDKKRDGDGLRMVLLREISDPVLNHVDPSDVAVGLAAVGL